MGTRVQITVETGNGNETSHVAELLQEAEVTTEQLQETIQRAANAAQAYYDNPEE